MAVQPPLAGIKVLDLTHVWAGPLAVRFLADLGAEVVKIEAPYGRGPQAVTEKPIGGFLGGAPSSTPWNDNAAFIKLMRNRRSVCCDLKTAEGLDLFKQLIVEADVLVENFSAAVMANFGLTERALMALNPTLIYVTMPGFGHDGPLAERVAFGPTIEAMSGLPEVMGQIKDFDPS